jgi:hypothetical protein
VGPFAFAASFSGGHGWAASSSSGREPARRGGASSFLRRRRSRAASSSGGHDNRKAGGEPLWRRSAPPAGASLRGGAGRGGRARVVGERGDADELASVVAPASAPLVEMWPARRRSRRDPSGGA